MNALLQHRGHVLMGAGHSIAVQNFNENIGILVMVGLYALMVRAGVSRQHGDRACSACSCPATMLLVMLAPPVQPGARRSRCTSSASTTHGTGTSRGRPRALTPRRLTRYRDDRPVGQLVAPRSPVAREVPREQRGDLARRPARRPRRSGRRGTPPPSSGRSPPTPRRRPARGCRGRRRSRRRDRQAADRRARRRSRSVSQTRSRPNTSSARSRGDDASQHARERQRGLDGEAHLPACRRSPSAIAASMRASVAGGNARRTSPRSVTR